MPLLQMRQEVARVVKFPAQKLSDRVMAMVSAVRAVVRVALLATFASAPAQADVVDPAPLDTVLIRHVHGGRVDYGALSRDPGPLRRYLAATENAAPERFSRDDQIAFWIDVYDARVLDGVIRHPGLASVLAADSAHGGPGFFKRTARSGGRALSLDAIEQELRSRWHEPRAHFALNCASTSCPALPPHALRGARLEAALDAATHGFLADSTRIAGDPTGCSSCRRSSSGTGRTSARRREPFRASSPVTGPAGRAHRRRRPCASCPTTGR